MTSPPGSIGVSGLARLVAQVGVPSSIALFLVWFLSAQVMSAIDDHAATSDELLQQLISISRQICLNTAENPVARSGCIVR
jgi:hypothetical protein